MEKLHYIEHFGNWINPVLIRFTTKWTDVITKWMQQVQPTQDIELEMHLFQRNHIYFH